MLLSRSPSSPWPHSARASAKSLVLSPEQARAELFGVPLSKVIEGFGAPWEECVEPARHTVFRFAGQSVEGRLTVDADGSACFTYADDAFRQRSRFRCDARGRITDSMNS